MHTAAHNQLATEAVCPLDIRHHMRDHNVHTSEPAAALAEHDKPPLRSNRNRQEWAANQPRNQATKQHPAIKSNPNPAPLAIHLPVHDTSLHSSVSQIIRDSHETTASACIPSIQIQTTMPLH